MLVIKRHIGSILVFFLSFCFLTSAANARRYYVHPKEEKKIAIEKMPDSPEKAEELEKLVKKDKGKILGVSSLEELARLYLEEKDVAGLKSLLKLLDKAQCVNIELLLDIARMISKEGDDVKTAVNLLYDLEFRYDRSRIQPPPEVMDIGWDEETTRNIARIRRNIAYLYRDHYNFEAARAAMFQAIVRDLQPDDYQFIGELMLLQHEYQPAIGAFMSSYFRSENLTSKKLVRLCYDSLGWAPAYYDNYFKEFYHLNLEEEVAGIESQRESGQARDFESLTIKELMGGNGFVLVFLDNSLNDLQLEAVNRLKKTLTDRLIPHKYVVFSMQTPDLKYKIVNENLDFTIQEHATEEVQEHYEVASFPTVLVMDRKGHFLYRITGTNLNMSKVFERLWDNYLKDQGLTAMVDQVR